MASQEEDDNYVLVFTILEEAKLTHLKSIFKDNCLQVRLNILSLVSRQWLLSFDSCENKLLLLHTANKDNNNNNNNNNDNNNTNKAVTSTVNFVFMSARK